MGRHFLASSAGVLAQAQQEQQTILNFEALTDGFGIWTTPGGDDPENPWTRITGASPTGSTGPSGGANSTTKAVEASNPYIYTEASNTGQASWSLQSPEIDASFGTSTLTFDFHMRFGSEGNITDGTLQVQGWNGSAWSNIGASVTGSQQSAAGDAYIGSASFTSEGFSNADFHFRILATRGASEFQSNYDFAVDNLLITGPAGALTGNVDPPVDPPVGNVRAASFNTGLRRIHVSPSSALPADGTTPDITVTTIQAGLNVLQAGDVMTVEDGDYFERPNRSNIPGTVANPVWIAAETPLGVRILDVKQAAFNGTQNWTLQNGATNRYSASIGDTYMALHNGDFLPKYSSVGNLDASSVNGQTKPDQGIAVSGNTLHIRLNGGTNPNGQSIIIPADDGRDVMDLGSSDNVIVDGFEFVGGGEQSGIAFDQGASNPMVTNCMTQTSRFLCRIGSNALVTWNDYRLGGCDQWMRECVSLNGNERAAFFDIIKGDLAQGGNAVYEGGIAVGAGGFNSGAVHQNSEFSFNRHFGVFDGERFGEWRNSTTHDNVYDECGDDGIQFEDDRNNNHGIGNRAFFCRFRNPHGPVLSHQNDGAATHEVIRCIVEITEPSIFRPEFLIKSIRTQPGSTIRYAHCYFENFATSGTRSPWYPFSTPSNSGGDEIDTFLNNIVVFPGGESPDFNSQSGGSPGDADSNAYVSTASEPLIQGSNGVFVGTLKSDLDLNADFTLQASSPARNIGQGLPGTFEDPITDSGANDDAGPFPFGFSPPLINGEWPRPMGEFFNVTDLPTRWTSPGA